MRFKVPGALYGFCIPLLILSASPGLSAADQIVLTNKKYNWYCGRSSGRLYQRLLTAGRLRFLEIDVAKQSAAYLKEIRSREKQSVRSGRLRRYVLSRNIAELKAKRTQLISAGQRCRAAARQVTPIPAADPTNAPVLSFTPTPLSPHSEPTSTPLPQATDPSATATPAANPTAAPTVIATLPPAPAEATSTPEPAATPIATSTSAPAATATSTPTSTATPAGTINASLSGNRLTIRARAGTALTVSQSGQDITVNEAGQSRNFSGPLAMIKVYANGGNLNIESSVSYDTVTYGSQSPDDLLNQAQASGAAIVSIAGGADTVQGNQNNTIYWCDVNTSDSISASAAETQAELVNQIGYFYQPFSTDAENPDYVPLELSGQRLRDPTDFTYSDRQNNPLYGSGSGSPVKEDIRQGGIGDCYYLAALASIAHASPRVIKERVVDLGDGTYAVRFDGKQAAPGGGIPAYNYLRLDSDMANGAAGLGTGNSIWVMVLEKAFAYYREGQNSYSSLDSGYLDEAFSALKLSYDYIAVSSSASSAYSAIAGYLAANKALVVGTSSTIQSGAPLIAGHAYSVVGASKDGQGNVSFTLRNPWGYDGAGSDGNSSDGLVTLTHAQFYANFSWMLKGM